jgi:subtilisin family serine protease
LEQLYGVTNLVPLDYYWHSPLPQQKTGYFQLSGTSMSCAVVSGTVALMLEDQPNLNPDTVKARLMASADEEVFNLDSTPTDIFTRGAGYLNVPAALEQTGVIASPNWAYSSVVVRLDGLVGAFMLCEPPGGPGPPQNPPPPPPPGGWDPPPPAVPPPTSILWGESMDWSYMGVYGGNTTWDNGNYIQEPIEPQPTSILWGERSLWEDTASWQDDDVWGASVVLIDTFGRAITGEKQRSRSGRWDHDTDPRGRYQDN